MKLFYKRNDCRLCGSSKMELVLSLAPMPIATPNFAVPDTAKSHAIFQEAVPLELHLCKDCGLLQLPHVGNPEIQYTNYVYTTSLSAGLTEHFKNYAADVLEKLAPSTDSLVVEMGSNDGTLLGFFKEAGMRVQGVDPAHEIARFASEQGIETYGAFFGETIANQILAEKGPASVMIANNVIANIDDLNDIVAGIRAILTNDGVFVLETQYGADVVEKNLLDTVYHEHLSYFNIKPLKLHFARHGMEIFDVERIWTKGGSIRVFVQHAGGPRPIESVVADMVQKEEDTGHYDQAIYNAWQNRIFGIRSALNDLVTAERVLGKPVGGYGVSVGTTTLLPQFEMTDKIDVLFDDDPNKDSELVGPGYRIPVHQTEAVYHEKPGVIVIFAWRYAELIIKKHQRYIEQGGKFIVPLPDVAACE